MELKCSIEGDKCDRNVEECCEGLTCFDYKGLNRCMPKDVNIGEIKGVDCICVLTSLLSVCLE